MACAHLRRATNYSSSGCCVTSSPAMTRQRRSPIVASHRNRCAPCWRRPIVACGEINRQREDLRRHVFAGSHPTPRIDSCLHFEPCRAGYCTQIHRRACGLLRDVFDITVARNPTRRPPAGTVNCRVQATGHNRFRGLRANGDDPRNFLRRSRLRGDNAMTITSRAKSAPKSLCASGADTMSAAPHPVASSANSLILAPDSTACLIMATSDVNVTRHHCAIRCCQ